jgi:hypothetical protein
VKSSSFESHVLSLPSFVNAATFNMQPFFVQLGSLIITKNYSKPRFTNNKHFCHFNFYASKDSPNFRYLWLKDLSAQGGALGKWSLFTVSK